MDRDWTFEACCSRGWAGAVLLLALLLMGLGMVAAGWGLLRLDDHAGTAVVIACVGGAIAIFVFGAAALIAFADLVRPREPVVVVDSFGVLDRRMGPGIIPWSAIRHARRAGSRLALEIDGLEPPQGPLARLLRGSRGAVTISLRGLTCGGHDIEAAIRRGLEAQRQGA